MVRGIFYVVFSQGKSNVLYFFLWRNIIVFAKTAAPAIDCNLIYLAVCKPIFSIAILFLPLNCSVK